MGTSESCTCMPISRKLSFRLRKRWKYLRAPKLASEQSCGVPDVSAVSTANARQELPTSPTAMNSPVIHVKVGRPAMQTNDDQSHKTSTLHAALASAVYKMHVCCRAGRGSSTMPYCSATW